MEVKVLITDPDLAVLPEVKKWAAECGAVLTTQFERKRTTLLFEGLGVGDLERG